MTVEAGSTLDGSACVPRDSGAPPGDTSIIYIYSCGNGVAEGNESCDRADLRQHQQGHIV